MYQAGSRLYQCGSRPGHRCFKTQRNPQHYGLSGSATQVERIYPPEKITEKQVITGDAATQADGLFALLGERKML